MAPCLSSYTKQRIVNLSKIYKSYTEIVRKLEEEEIRVSRQTISKQACDFSAEPRNSAIFWKKFITISFSQFVEKWIETPPYFFSHSLYWKLWLRKNDSTLSIFSTLHHERVWLCNINFLLHMWLRKNNSTLSTFSTSTSQTSLIVQY